MGVYFSKIFVRKKGISFLKFKLMIFKNKCTDILFKWFIFLD